MESLEKQVDKMLSVVLDVQRDVKQMSERVKSVEGNQERTYDKIDGFLNLINRHEAEIAAVRSKMSRLEDRLEKLEARST